MSSVQHERPDVIDPTTGEIIDLENVDAMAAAYERIAALSRQLWGAKAAIAKALGDLTEGETKTRRLRGERCRVRVEMPKDSYDSGMLKEALNAYPEHGKLYLRIARVEPIAKEVKKLANETGPADFMQFKTMVLGANQGPTGTPRITVEEAPAAP